jgi:hypothetical protein
MVFINKIIGGAARRSLFAGALLLIGCPPAMAFAGSPDVLVYGADAAQPPVARVIGPVEGFACRAVATPDSEAEAVARVKQRAAEEGATAVINLRVEVRASATNYLRWSGFPNPCRFQTDAVGTAVILTTTQAG